MNYFIRGKLKRHFFHKIGWHLYKYALESHALADFVELSPPCQAKY